MNRRSALADPRINLIVAMTGDYIIGASNRLPWKLSADLKRFRRLTTPHAVIMGRKTYESIGRPLPKRRNIVVTRRRGYRPQGCLAANSLSAAIRKAGKETRIFVIGGGELYREALPMASRIYLTLIDADDERQPFLFEPFSGDAHFPAIDRAAWRLLRPGTRRLAMPSGTRFADDPTARGRLAPIYYQFLTLARRKRSARAESGAAQDLSWLKPARPSFRTRRRAAPERKAKAPRSQRDLFT